MQPIIVLGNGESRKDIKLLPLKDHYTLIGCNAIHRDIEVDHLFASVYATACFLLCIMG